MARRLHSDHLAIQAQREIHTAPDWSDMNENTRRAMRETSPIQPGDVVRIGSGQRALVVQVLAQRLPVSDDLCPMFRVRPIRKDGAPALAWRYVWAGQIDRAYTA